MTRIDTIVAPATPPGRSALAVVRIDGPDSAAILEALTRRPAPPPREAVFAKLFLVAADRTEPELLDECVAVRFVAPQSFSGNDLVELTIHGNPLLVERLIGACTALGARIAEPGEFSERAVLNGKIDLVQAEAIAELINARTALQARLSLSNLEGHLSRTVAAIRAELLDVISRTEAALDFSDEGYEFVTREETAGILARAQAETASLAGTWRRGRATTNGLLAAILGRPNAGKSTLLNRLVGSDRAIVTEIPGTTRDVIRETIEVGGLPVTLADTAGLRESGDVVEGIGVERAREEARRADVVIYLIDSASGKTSEDERELETLRGDDRLVLEVYSRADLAGPPAGATAISVVTGEGVAGLLAVLDSLVRERFAAPDGALVNERQRSAVATCAEALEMAAQSVREGRDEQIVLVDLYRAARALGELTGAISRNDVLAEIFSKFCIGK